LKYGGEVFEGEARRNGVYADGEFGDVRGTGLREAREDVLPCGGFLRGGYAVFKIVGDGVYGEGAGFLEELGGGGRD
jgi:hypothetical protein